MLRNLNAEGLYSDKRGFNPIVLRFQERVRSNQYPVYDIIVIKQECSCFGRFEERLGFYSPHSLERIFFLNSYKLDF